jgi:sporulation protein YlmC with PRC-barrel domain
MKLDYTKFSKKKKKLTPKTIIHVTRVNQIEDIIIIRYYVGNNNYSKIKKILKHLDVI